MGMKQKLRTKRNPELHGGRIRIGIVADLPNRRYFFDGGWPSGRRMLSTHRSGGGRMYKPVAAYSRTRRRGRSLKISIRDFHCNERRSRRTAKRLSISCKSTTGIAARGAPNTSRGRCTLACY